MDAEEWLQFVKTTEFLNSYQWRSARMLALKTHGARCQCCGATKEDGIIINVDHIKPRKTHPELALEQTNLQILCGPCNHGKGNWDATDWRIPEDKDERIYLARRGKPRIKHIFRNGDTLCKLYSCAGVRQEKFMLLSDEDAADRTICVQCRNAAIRST